MPPIKEFAIVNQTANGAFQQAFELLTASLLFFEGKEAGALRTLCVVAAQSGYGASTTSLNLALTIASSSRRTLLIDGNLRAPSLHQPFGLQAGPGLAEILMGKALFRDAIKATRTSNLYFLPAGQAPGSPHALLQSAMLAAALEQVRTSYDFAVVDTPPALGYPDALHIARATDGALLVIPAEGAPRRAEVEVRRRLERAGVRILGVVVNRVHPKDALFTA
ncbi:MAG TPA: CpsD/CapB family tyrosine-protein kinase [Chloroflexota bacterium]|nr:CpsD/CapB family tyrosine-protein kinase [Chloroflexota bacterium]